MTTAVCLGSLQTVRLSILAKSIYICTTSMSRSSEEMKFSRTHRNFEFQEYSKRLKNIHGTQSQSKQLTVRLSARTDRRRDPFLSNFRLGPLGPRLRL